MLQSDRPDASDQGGKPNQMAWHSNFTFKEQEATPSPVPPFQAAMASQQVCTQHLHDVLQISITNNVL
jgi:hypothetical protein